MKLHSVNKEQRLYVVQCGAGFSCYGFDVLDRKARAVAEWLQRHGMPCAGWTCAARDFLLSTADCAPGRSGLPVVPGTARHFELAARVLDQGARYSAATGERCGADLCPQLRGLEGCRVEVIRPDGERARFIVGMSSGWLPCHLEIKTRRSTAGESVYVPAGSTVRVLERVRAAPSGVRVLS